MAKLPPKKRPRMTRLESQAARNQEEADFEATLDASADRVFDAIEKARGKMTDSERELADKNAAAILERATDPAERSQRRA